MTMHPTAPTLILLVAAGLGPLHACGVKAPPTPVLSAPPSPLQLEAEKRKQEKLEKAKKQKTSDESAKP
ncbi:MAG: hypothetical protein RIR26_2197 [Pseudomonadota bacterium]